MRRKSIFIAIIIIISSVFIYELFSDGTKSTYRIVLDPGHGGEDVGAIGASGSCEKDFTLNVALKAKQLLEQDSRIKVEMTREDDRHISQKSRYRSKFANDVKADLFVSIHGNAFSDSDATGTETFYHRRKSRSFAQAIHKHIVAATGFPDRHVQKGNFFVIKDTKMPSVLLEIGFLTNPDEESVMLSEEFQDQIAEAIVAGIEDYLFDS